MLQQGVGAYSFVDCLDRLTIDHASLSKRSTVPTANRNNSNIWALSKFLTHVTFFFFFFALFPSSLAVCGHRLSPSIAVVFSPLSNVPDFSASHPPIFLVHPCTVHIR